VGKTVVTVGEKGREKAEKKKSSQGECTGSLLLIPAVSILKSPNRKASNIDTSHARIDLWLEGGNGSRISDPARIFSFPFKLETLEKTPILTLNGHFEREET